MPFKKTDNTYNTGKGSNAKAISVRLLTEEGEDELYVLSSRQASALLKISEYLEWRNRYFNMPSELVPQDDFDKWNDQIKTRLMTPMEICARIIDCIENDEDVQNALKLFINNHLASLDNNPVGKPLPASVTGAPLGENPTCDWDILWAQCLMVVKTTNDIIEDLLDKFETLTNPVELTGAALEAIPAAGDTVAAVPNYVALIQEFLAENYSADYTTTPVTGYEDRLAAEIFCACEMDCEITIDRIVQILIDRIETRFDTTVPALSVLNDLAAWLIGIDTGGELIADMAFLLVWGGLKFANFVIGGLLNRPRIGDGVIKVWLALATDNPSNDWVFIVDCVDIQCWDMSIVPNAVVLEGELSTDEVYETFVHATSIAAGAKGEINFTYPVQLDKWTYDAQSLSGGNSTIEGYVKFYLGEDEVLVAHNFVTANQGGFVWKESNAHPARIDDTTGAGTVFDRVEFFFQKDASGTADEFADCYFQVCFVPDTE